MQVQISVNFVIVPNLTIDFGYIFFFKIQGGWFENKIYRIGAEAQ